RGAASAASADDADRAGSAGTVRDADGADNARTDRLFGSLGGSDFRCRFNRSQTPARESDLGRSRLGRVAGRKEYRLFKILRSILFADVLNDRGRNRPTSPA